MKLKIALFLLAAIAASCNNDKKQNPMPLVGTWELIAATSTEKDSTTSTFNPHIKMIKIINPTHFAFLSHDLSMGKDIATAKFTAGGGGYTRMKIS